MTPGNEAYFYERFFPAAPLSAFIKFFYYFHGFGSCPERILPMSLTEITFNITADCVKSFIVPSGNQPYFVVPRILDRVIGICFHPWGLQGLFKLPAGQLGRMKIPLIDALRIPSREMTECMMNGGTPRQMVANLEIYLESRIGNIQHTLIRDAVQFIDSRHGQVDLSEFYSRYTQSTRRLQMIFDHSIGMSPKRYSRLKRFQYAVTRLTPATGLTSLALDTGYYDQPHFIHEFRAFAGTHPKSFLKEKNQLNAINARNWF